MKHHVKRWVLFTLRWGIAVAGIAWVLSKVSFHDRVVIFDAGSQNVQAVRVLGDAKETDAQFRIVDTTRPQAPVREVSREELWTGTDLNWAVATLESRPATR